MNAHPGFSYVKALLMATHHKEIPAELIAEAIMDRTHQNNAVAVLKSLIVFHRLMRDGHEVCRFLFSFGWPPCWIAKS